MMSELAYQSRRTLNHFTATATRRTSTAWIVTPGPDQSNARGFTRSACSAVSKRTRPNPSPSAGSNQYPPTNPSVALTRGRMSFEKAAAAAGARAASIVSFTTAAYMLVSLHAKEHATRLHVVTACCIASWSREFPHAPGDPDRWVRQRFQHNLLTTLTPFLSL